MLFHGIADASRAANRTASHTATRDTPRAGSPAAANAGGRESWALFVAQLVDAIVAVIEAPVSDTTAACLAGTTPAKEPLR